MTEAEMVTIEGGLLANVRAGAAALRDQRARRSEASAGLALEEERPRAMGTMEAALAAATQERPDLQEDVAAAREALDRETAEEGVPEGEDIAEQLAARDKQIAELKARLDQEKAENQRLQERLETQDKRIGQLESQVRELNKTIADFRTQVESLQRQLNEVRIGEESETVRQLQKRIAELEAQGAGRESGAGPGEEEPATPAPVWQRPTPRGRVPAGAAEELPVGEEPTPGDEPTHPTQRLRQQRPGKEQPSQGEIEERQEGETAEPLAPVAQPEEPASAGPEPAQPLPALSTDEVRELRQWAKKWRRREDTPPLSEEQVRQIETAIRYKDLKWGNLSTNLKNAVLNHLYNQGLSRQGEALGRVRQWMTDRRLSEPTSQREIEEEYLREQEYLKLQKKLRKQLPPGYVKAQGKEFSEVPRLRDNLAVWKESFDSRDRNVTANQLAALVMYGLVDAGKLPRQYRKILQKGQWRLRELQLYQDWRQELRLRREGKKARFQLHRLTRPQLIKLWEKK